MDSRDMCMIEQRDSLKMPLCVYCLLDCHKITTKHHYCLSMENESFDDTLVLSGKSIGRNMNEIDKLIYYQFQQYIRSNSSYRNIKKAILKRKLSLSHRSTVACVCLCEVKSITK